jgi:hypothetical protein
MQMKHLMTHGARAPAGSISLSSMAAKHAGWQATYQCTSAMLMWLVNLRKEILSGWGL